MMRVVGIADDFGVFDATRHAGQVKATDNLRVILDSEATCDICAV